MRKWLRNYQGRLFGNFGRSRSFSPLPPDAVHLSSCIIDFWYATVTSLATDGRFLSWQNIAAPPETWSAGSPGYLYRVGTGVYNLGAGGFTGTVKTLTGALTLYWLADYAGVAGVPLVQSEGNGAFSISGTTANITNDAGTSKTKDGTLSGNRLYRWRRTSANACYFKPGAGAEVSIGTLAGDISVSSVLPTTDDDDNRTRRILMYNADLVTDGTSTGVEAAIIDVVNTQTSVTITVSGDWTIPTQLDTSKAVKFEAFAKGGLGGVAEIPTNAGGGGGGGGGYMTITAPSMAALGWIAGQKYAVDITGGDVVISDPGAQAICQAVHGGTGSFGGGGAGGVGGTPGYPLPTSPAGYIAESGAYGGAGGLGGTNAGGGGGGGGAGRSGNGGAGQKATLSTGGAGGIINAPGGHGYSAGTAGTAPGGGGGGGEANTNSGDPSDPGAAWAVITYYINTTP